MTTTVRARNPADLAVLLSYQLGYHPGPSVVLIALRDKRLGPMQRHDLPSDPDACLPAARRAIDIARREDPSGVILIAHEDVPDASAPLREAMLRVAEDAGVPVNEHVVVRGGRWYQPGCRDSCCPEAGLPLPRPEDVPAVAAYVHAGVAPFASREALVAHVLPERDAGRAREVGLHLAGLGRQAGTTTFGGGPTRGARSWWWDTESTARSWMMLLDPTPGASPVPTMADADLARVAASLQDAQLRDALMAVLCPGTLPLESLDPFVLDVARLAAVRCVWSHDFGELVEEGLLDEEEAFARGADELDETDHEELEAVRARLVEFSRLLPEAATPDALALIAHLAWFVGDGTVTGICLERALEVDPEHRLSGLMMQLLSVGVRPWSTPGSAGDVPGEVEDGDTGPPEAA